MASVCMRIFFLSWIVAGELASGIHFTLEQDDTKYQASTSMNNVRYRLSSHKLPFYEAMAECKNDGSNLVVVSSDNVTMVIETMLEGSSLRGGNTINASLINHGVWIGLKLLPEDKMRGMWSDQTLFDTATSYSNWVPNEPKPEPETLCVQLWKAYFWEWDDTYCDEMRNYICEDQDPQTYSTQQVQNLTESIVELGFIDSPTTTSLNKMVSQVSTLLDIQKKTIKSSEASKRDVLLAIENITNNYNASQGSFESNRENVLLEIDNLSEISTYHNKVSFGEDFSEELELASSVTLSEDLLEETQQRAPNQQIQLSSVVYRKTTLFQTISTNLNEEVQFGEGAVRSKKPQILSHVISVDVQNVDMSNLRSPVIVQHLSTSLNSTFMKLRNNKTKKSTSVDGNKTELVVNNINTKDSVRTQSKVVCVYWDFDMNAGEGGWSDYGCDLSSVTTQNGRTLVTCSCNHMTNFAIILDVSEFYEPEYLTYLTKAGCAITIACLMATLFTNLFFKQLRTKLPQQMLMHICFSLILLNTVFLLGIDRKNEETFCFVTTALLHYAVLLSWFWMLAEGVFLYRTLAIGRISSGTGKCFIWSTSTICYGLPAIVVATLAALEIEGYQSERYCWLSGDILLYSLVIPVSLMLVINCIIFVVVMYNITLRSQMFRKNINLEKISQSLRRAACMMVVLGLPWIFGYIMLLSKNEEVKSAFSVIFTIFNAFQGFAIFMLYCVRQENVRNLWFQPVQKQYRQTIKRLKPPARSYTKQNFTNDMSQDSHSSRKKSSLEYPETPRIYTLPSSGNPVQQNEKPPLPPKKLPFRSGWV